MTRDYKELARRLGFRAIHANWDEYGKQPWLIPLLEAEEEEKGSRSVKKRVQDAKIGSFKPMAEFNWNWPTRVDRQHIEELFNLDFLRDRANIALIGTIGLGKTMIAQNLAHEAATNGHSTFYFKASKMLNNLLECDGAAARKRMLKRLCGVPLLVIDEIGYMEYDNRYADLLFEVVSERYQKKSTIITTNKVFQEWSELFPTAACVVSMVDKLVHNSEIVVIEGRSYRLHEAEQRTEEKTVARKARSKRKKDDKIN